MGVQRLNTMSAMEKRGRSYQKVSRRHPGLVRIGQVPQFLWRLDDSEDLGPSIVV